MPEKREDRGATPNPDCCPQRPCGTTSLLAAVVVILVVASLLLSCGKQGDEGTSTENDRPPDASTWPPAKGNLEKLLGQWLRPDGGYVIEITRIGAKGRLDAAYFNPRPINVSRATATVEGKETQVFLELYDEGYPGSTYTLTYDPPSDALFGTYFQAALGQSFEVVFVRRK